MAKLSSELFDKEDPISTLATIALAQNASDIHIEPLGAHYRIRLRVDGLLKELCQLANEKSLRLINQLKILAHLDITEKRLPLDGRMQLKLNEINYDFRISTCPTIIGEKIVVRLLKEASSLPAIENLGLDEHQLNLFHQALNRSHGMILVTGPTGSGKTTTLYSALNFLNTLTKNIITIEDPIEIQLPGINQVASNKKLGLDFATALRAFLRQDPDIIMVGEIRDNETAEIAIKAAETGHLVLSTLHTSNALESLVRLINMNIDPVHLAYGLQLIIAQRLIRKLCSHCKQSQKIKNNITLYQPHYCSKCTDGYKGRTGVFEFLTMNDMIRENLINKLPITSKNLPRHKLMHHHAQQLLFSGITSHEEIKEFLPINKARIH